MSFRVGQILSDNLRSENLLIEKSFQIEDLETTNDITLNKFTDKRITSIENTQGFISDHHYYIKLVIKRKFPNSNQNIILRLSNDGLENTSKNYQYIDDFLIYAGDIVSTNNLDYAVYETIVTPHANYSQINIILGRQIIDYYTTTDPETGLSWDQSSGNIENYKGRVIEIMEDYCQIYDINNVLDTSSIPRVLTKIGIQGPPGMLMCINGEPIRIGPSGIYEIKNGYKINFLSFIRKESYENGAQQLDSFIVDYQYDDSTTSIDIDNTLDIDNQNNNEEGE